MSFRSRTGTSTCQKCGDPTWNGAHLCVSCKRKPAVRIQCAFPDCKETLIKVGKSLYCIDHKSLTARERKVLMKSKKQTAAPTQLIQAAVKEGFSKLFPEGMPDETLSLLTSVAAKGNYLLWAEEEGIIPELLALSERTP